VVSYHHVIHSLRKKPFRRRRTCGSMALMGLVYRDQLFPRQAFRDIFAVMLERATERVACRMMVNLSALAVEPQVRLWRNDRSCEAELAAQLKEDLHQKRLPDIAALTALFAPSRGSLPGVEVQLADLSAYDQLLGNAPMIQEVELAVQCGSAQIRMTDPGWADGGIVHVCLVRRCRRSRAFPVPKSARCGGPSFPFRRSGLSPSLDQNSS